MQNQFLISYAFVFVASFFNAVMDVTGNVVKFNTSIIKNFPPNFWVKDVSWKFAPKIFGWKADAWHIAKSGMIICFAGAIIFFKPQHQWWVHFISIGIVWNVGFWLFYNKLFGVK